jgi:hypothetical protein
MCSKGKQKNGGRKNMDMTMKELRLHGLRCDVISCGRDGLSKKGIKDVLFRQYVFGTEIPVTAKEFNAILDEEYPKVEAWRTRRIKAGK